MREYEIVYIFRSNFTPEEIEARIERYHALLTGDGKGEITAVEQWGKRQLAYPIQKQPNGYYVVAQFTADPAMLPEFERVITLEEDLLRYLIVLSEGELPIPGSMQSAMDDRVTGPPAAPGGGAAAEAGDATTEAAKTEDTPAEESTDDSPADESGEDASDDAADESSSEDDEGAGSGDEEPSSDGDEAGEEEAGAEASDDDGGDDAEDDDAADDAAEKEE